MNEMTHLTAEERGTLDRARETPFARGIFDHSRTGYGCNCGWASKVHGDTCPEHGNPARRTMEIDASTVEKLLANLNAARAKLAALTIEHEHAMQALMLGEDEAKKELLAARAKLAKLPRTADGVEIVPGASVYTLTGELIIIAIVDMFEFDGPVYSTREAALAAKGEVKE